jgi:thiamine pyrophosphate-dependent acetolactate synthase large subunit-like protein
MMGMVSPFCLGLSLAMPTRAIWGIEGDGAIAMNLGNLLTLANERPANLVHFIMDNRAYESTGGQPLVDAGRADFVEIAKGCGIEHAYGYDDLDAFAADAKAHLSRGTYTLLVFRIDLPTYSLPPAQRTAMSQPVEMAYRFIRHVEQVEDKQILA